MKRLKLSLVALTALTLILSVPAALAEAEGDLPDAPAEEVVLQLGEDGVDEGLSIEEAVEEASAPIEVLADSTNEFITAQPQNSDAKVGETATFSVTAVGEGLTYQWQFKGPKDSDWRDSTLAGCKTNTLKVYVNDYRSQMKFHCLVTKGTISEPSLEVGFTSQADIDVPTLTITQQPKDAKIDMGATGTFTVAASGSNLSYQWQYQVGDGAWTNDGSDSDSYTLTMTSQLDGAKVRCVVTDGNTGLKATSASAIFSSNDIERQVVNGVIYESVNGVMTVTGYSGSDTALNIEATVNGQAVTAIAEGAFKGATTLESITLPKTITTIGTSAFDGCTQLKSIG